jgi:hypothetical protein
MEDGFVVPHLQRGMVGLARSAAAATAIGCLLAFTQRSEAKIVYTPVNEVIKDRGQLQLDLNNDGIVDFTINGSSSGNQACFFGIVDIFPSADNGVVISGERNGDGWASALNAGDQIGPIRDFFSQESILTQYDHGFNCVEGGYTYGYWLDAGLYYLGLEFQKYGKTRYGWAQLSVHSSTDYRHNQHLTTTLSGYAYETVAGKSIVAGNTFE